MVEKRLVNYISKYLNQGFPENQIRNRLIKDGWNKDTVSEGIKEAKKKISKRQGKTQEIERKPVKKTEGNQKNSGKETKKQGHKKKSPDSGGRGREEDLLKKTLITFLIAGVTLQVINTILSSGSSLAFEGGYSVLGFVFDIIIGIGIIGALLQGVLTGVLFYYLYEPVVRNVFMKIPVINKLDTLFKLFFIPSLIGYGIGGVFAILGSLFVLIGGGLVGGALGGLGGGALAGGGGAAAGGTTGALIGIGPGLGMLVVAIISLAAAILGSYIYAKIVSNKLEEDYPLKDAKE